MTHFIKNRQITLPEAGRIKIGEKGVMTKTQGGKEFQPPVKLDYFKITKGTRGKDGNFEPDLEMQKALEDKYGKPLRKIPVKLLYSDPNLNMPTVYGAYQGQKLFCLGDGEKAMRMGGDGQRAEVECTCERVEAGYGGKDKCKINGVLSVLIDGYSKVGGAHKFRTTSYNTVDGVLGAMTFITQLSGGKLANLPLFLTLTPKKVQTYAGPQQQIYVVGLEYIGSVEDLQGTALEIAEKEVAANLQLEHVEARVREQFNPNILPEEGEEAQEVIEEFYPDAVLVEGEDQPDLNDFQQFLQDLIEATKKGEGDMFKHNNLAYIKKLNETQIETVKFEMAKLKGEQF